MGRRLLQALPLPPPPAMGGAAALANFSAVDCSVRRPSVSSCFVAIPRLRLFVCRFPPWVGVRWLPELLGADS